MALIGIDLGTTNSLAAVWKDGKSVLIPNCFGEFLTPSVVSMDQDGTVLVGKTAKERLISHPFMSIASFKRFMGQKKTFMLGKKPFSPEELSSFILRRLREDAEAWLGEPVTEAIISVPAYFNDAARAATKRAGELAGIYVERLVNEPSAAALAFRMQNRENDQCFLVFDFGGGTLDVSVVDCFDDIVEITAISGNNHLGGDDFDQIIVNQFCAENKLKLDSLSAEKQAILLKLATQCKHTLGHQGQSLVVVEDNTYGGSLAMTNQKLFELSAGLFAGMSDVIRNVLKDSRKHPGDFDRIILVGGSCKMPVVKQYLSHIFQTEVEEIAAPNTVTALGAGVYAGIKERRGEVRDVLLTDICPFTLGVDILNPADPARPIMCPIIERNCTLPASRVKRFFTAGDYQKQIDTSIYQGEAMYCDENILLGALSTAVKPAPRGQEQVDIRFTYDINGILEVEITNVSSGEKTEKTIVSKDIGINAKEIKKRCSELLLLKINPRDEEENRLIIARAERLFAESTGDIRAIITGNLLYFQQVIDSEPKQSVIRKERENMRAFLDSIEGG